MKTLFKLTIFGILLTMLSAVAFAQTGPQSIYIDCQSPSGSEGGLKRPRGDANVWVFQIIPGADVTWVEGPNWSYPGKGGSDPSWGQWNGGDGTLSLSWISPEHTGAFNIGVTGKITCGSGGDGDPIDISAMWSGEVLAKDWKAEPAISGGEVTQPAGTDAENPKEVGPGETVNLAVSEATDQDTWTQAEDTGQEADTVHYKWTSGDGGFVTEDHPDGDATEVTAISAQWKAPEEPGDYTVTCEIDDEPAAVEEPDTGERNDDPLTRTVNIKVVVGESSATLKLYKDAELTEEATGTIGGSVYVVLEVKLGKYQKLVSNNATLRIEENYEEHSETERRWDQTVNFDSGWQKKDANGEWQTTTETPQSKNSSGDEKYFRKVWSWATYSQPLGHNEQHTVEIVQVDGGEDSELSFTPTNEGDDGKNGPEAVNTDVANLVITDVSTNSGNPSYFLFDPHSEDDSIANPSITFTFKNDGDTESSHNRYHWWLWVRATDQTNFATYEGDMDAPGEKSVPIDPDDLPSVGTYAIDIHVWDTKNDDWQGILSTKLSLSSHRLELVNNSNAEWEAQISYKIISDRNAQKLTVDLFNPSLDKLKSHDGGAQRDHLYDGITLYTFTDDDPGGTYIAVFTAEDNFADAYRGHKSRDILAMNARNSAEQASNYDVSEGSLFGFSTRMSATVAANTQNHDYFAKALSNTTASVAHERLAKDSVFWYAGHGNNAAVDFSPKGDGARGILSYPGTQWDPEVQVYYVFENNLKFFGTTGCTMATGTKNVLTEVKRLGASGVLGFASSPESGWCERYSELFWHYALQTYKSGSSTTKLGRVHSDAARAAAVQLASENNGDFHGFNSPRNFGTSVRLTNHEYGKYLTDYMEISPPYPDTSMPWGGLQ